ncbi:hypothetical protein OQA88_12930 [Cercophora sp. LCS_1]
MTDLDHHRRDDEWTTGTSSSAKTSDRMTPDSDGDGDGVGDEDMYAAVEHGDDEAYELEERGGYGEKEDEEEGDEDEQEVLVGGYDGADDGDVVPGSWRRRGRSVSTAASFQLYTPDEEKAVVRKFDRRLVVFMAVLYMLSFVDRSNIGNARIAGMDDDLQSTPPKTGWYEWALAAFYITYILFEWMALLWRIIPAHIYVSVLVLSWGLVASLQGVAINYPMLIALRALLGIGEAGFTGVPYYLSFFFKPHELAFRTAIFISAAPLATTFASSLAYLIIKASSYSPIASWRLLFLIEGFPSLLAAAVAYHLIPDSPQTAPYLTARQKKVARLRLRQPRTAKPNQTSYLRDTLSVLLSPPALLTSAIFFLTNMAYSSLPVFLPTILTSMGHTPLASQALAAPPYFASFLLVLATAYISDATRSRSPFIIFHALFSASGYALLALSGPGALNLDAGSWVRYLAVYPATIGFFNVVVLTVAWSLNNQMDERKRGGGFAMLQMVGQCGPLVGTGLYPDGEGPFYTRGMGVCAGAMLMAGVLAGFLRWWLGRVNRREGKEGMYML